MKKRGTKWLAAALSAQTLAATSSVPAIAQEVVPAEEPAARASDLLPV